MKLSRESWIIFVIGITDLATTLLWVNSHGAQEANPVFAHYLAMGPVVFALMKLVMLAAPIYLLEWARKERPVFTIRAARFAICAYILLYGVGFVKLNAHFLGTNAGVDAVAMAEIPVTPDGVLARH